MHVLIVGGGIGGLSTALTLHQLGISCAVYEAVSELKPLGVGINLQTYSVRELFNLGLEETLLDAGISAEGMAYFTRRGQHLLTDKIGSAAGFDWPQLHMHRGAFQMILAREVQRRLGPDALRLGHQCVNVEQHGGQVTAHFQDRRTGASLEPATGDILIAADGINSSVRPLFYKNEKPPHWNRTIMWRGITEGVRILDGHTMCVTGLHHHKFVCYHIKKPAEERREGESNLLLNWICELKAPDDMEFRPESWNRAGDMSEFLPAFEPWRFDWIDVPEIVTRHLGIWEFPMVDRDPLPQWTFGRVALLGDAAHPLTPVGSNGASLAVIDARILGRELAMRPDDPEAALEAYEADRRPALTRILQSNRKGGPEEFMPLVEERAPDGFDDIHDVLSEEELQTAANYRAMTGLTTDSVNAVRSLIPTELFVN